VNFQRLLRGLELLGTPGALRAMLTWPQFSLAAYRIVTRLRQLGAVPRTVIDVGANIGQFAVACSRIFPEASIFPIEPDPRAAARLKQNLDERTRAHLKITAVGDRVGQASFNVNRDSQVSSLLPLGQDRILSFPNARVLETITVPMNTLDALFANADLESPVLLKIDVQGFEDRVIAGAARTLEGVRWIVMEIAFGALYEGERDFESIAALVRSAGFSFVRPLDFHVSPRTGQIIEMDALFERASAKYASVGAG